MSLIGSAGRFAGLFGACLLLLILTRLNASVLPLAWPDEALFSAPAASLVVGGNFATPVLAGLIPGMERATLWNSPLFMVLLAGPYALFGESQAIGRAFTFVLALIALALFALLAGRLLRGIAPDRGADHRPLRERVAAALPLILVCDLSFQRAANTIRMDMLTLCFMLGAFYCFLRDRDAARSGNSKHSWRWPLAAGACVGGAALSHPIAVLLVPLVLIWTLPRWRSLFLTGAGTLSVFSLWLPYIFTHLQLFCVQFVAQLARKKDILSLFGGETGGVLRVYAAQYGGQGFWMLLAGGMVLLAAFASLWRLAREWRSSAASAEGGASNSVQQVLNRIRRVLDSEVVRLVASLATVFVLVLLSSEAWYPLYVGPFLLLTTARLYCDASHASAPTVWQRLQPESLALPFAAFALAIGTLSFMFREHIVYDTPTQVARFEAAALDATRDCRAVYLRVRPDPYFALRERRAEQEFEQEILEFIPGKLQFDPREMPFPALRECMAIPGGHHEMLRRRYDSIDCFLLDSNDAWEPPLRDYLRENAGSFETIELPALPPLDAARLVRRR